MDLDCIEPDAWPATGLLEAGYLVIALLCVSGGGGGGGSTQYTQHCIGIVLGVQPFFFTFISPF